ncbi:unnamed protein product [Mytilus coruscus]|uniref:PiggyBac transposable element-derived protein domain-containing protein n=1 Tax=Mytilus coruscus TaxID=42192 RepID=A0A6J8D0Y4_MYTCO|nr:unnamed protein product [Mytilus coruscus]
MADHNPWFRIYPPEVRDHTEVNQTVGPKRMPLRNSRPIAYSMLIFTIALMKNFVLETNRYARNFIRRNRHNISNKSRVHDWRKKVKLALIEFKPFVDVILNMGLIRKATISECWNRKHSSQSTPWFRKVFTRNRFQLMLKFLHLVDNRHIAPRNSPSYDPTAKFKPIVDHFNLKAKTHYFSISKRRRF